MFETGETIPAEALFLEYREATAKSDPRGISARRWHDLGVCDLDHRTGAS